MMMADVPGDAPDKESKDEEKESKPGFKPSMAIMPISMMVVLLIVTLSMALWIGPYYDAMGIRSEFSGLTDNPLYAFVFLGFVIAFAVVILILRKLLKRRKLKLKYFFAIAVFFSTMYVVLPLLDIAANGSPDVWDVRYFDVDDPKGVVPIDPANPEYGILIFTDSSFHFMVNDDNNKYAYEETFKVDGFQKTYDPHFLNGEWVVCGEDDSGYNYWIVDKRGDLLSEGTVENDDDSMYLNGINLVPINGTNHLLTTWRNAMNLSDVLVHDIDGDEGYRRWTGWETSKDIPHSTSTGWSTGRTWLHNDTSILNIGSIVFNEDTGIWVNDIGIENYEGNTWLKGEGEWMITFTSRELFTPGLGMVEDNVVFYYEGPAKDDLTLSSSTHEHTHEIESPYHASFAQSGDVDSTDGLDYRLVTLYGKTVTVSEYGTKDIHTYTEEPISVYQDGRDGDIFLVFDGLVQHGHYTDAVRMQSWIQIAAFVISGIIIAVLLIKPKWWLIDLSGILMGAGVVALMGVSFPIAFTMMLMVLLAVYDAVAVYKTKHMIALADSVVESKMPILLVFPMKWSYRYEDETNLMDPKRKRESMFMGLGDVIIPGILVVSAFTYLPRIGGTGIPGLGAPLTVAITTMIGMLVGFGILMRWVIKGKAHAGLPPLNGGAILGFLLGHLIVYGSMVFW